MKMYDGGRKIIILEGKSRFLSLVGRGVMTSPCPSPIPEMAIVTPSGFPPTCIALALYSIFTSARDLGNVQAPPRKKQLVTYCMQPRSEQAGYVGPRQDGHRFGVNRILRLPSPNNAGEDGDGSAKSSLISAGRDGIVRRWDVSSLLEEAADTAGAAAKEQPGEGRRRRRQQQRGSTGDFAGLEHYDADVHQEGSPAVCSSPCTCEAILASHTDWVTGLAAAEGRILVSSSNDGTLKLWDLANTTTDSGRTTGSQAAGDMDVDKDDGGDTRTDDGGEMANRGACRWVSIRSVAG